MKSIPITERIYRPTLAAAALAVALGGLAVILTLLIPASGPVAALRGDQQQMHPVAPPTRSSIRPCSGGHMCVDVLTGTSTGTCLISNPNGLGVIADHHAVNFDQRVVSRSSITAQVEIVSRAYFETTTAFPLDVAALPDDVQPYLLPTESQQSDDPAIIAQAQALVSGAQTEVQAVNAILDWVRANIAYDHTFSLPNDAVSVYQNRSGVCTGFSNLAVALLRAADMPARKNGGCVLSESGWRHAWIETYYPDAGWVLSDPQVGLENWVSPSHLFDGFDECGVASTDVIWIDFIWGDDVLYELATSYPDDISSLVQSASVPSWDRHPLHINRSQLVFMLERSESSASTTIQVESTDCYSTGWRMVAGVPWITLSPSQGVTRTEVLATVNTVSLPLGINSAIITVTTSGLPVHAKTIAANVWIVEHVHEIYTPVILNMGGP